MKGHGMVTSIMMIKAERNKITSLATTLADISEIAEVYSVTGKYDLVAIVRVKDNEALAKLATEKLINIDGIKDTETMLALRSYSRHDLESMFSIGFEEN
jgi:DNA-binding Lrp family transcriptional regulator